MLNKQEMVQKFDNFFDTLNREGYKKYSVEELITIIEAIIPVHVGLEISDFDDVDALLSIYPYLFQKLVKVYAYFVHEVRSHNADRKYSNDMRSYRDAFEELLKVVKLNYDALSRRITNSIDRRQ